jgi:hypothetical protein
MELVTIFVLRVRPGNTDRHIHPMWVRHVRIVRLENLPGRQEQVGAAHALLENTHFHRAALHVSIAIHFIAAVLQIFAPLETPHNIAKTVRQVNTTSRCHKPHA